MQSGNLVNQPLWERIVHSIKFQEIFDLSLLNEKMITLLNDCEYSMNRRILTYIFADLNNSMMPTHFIQDMKRK